MTPLESYLYDVRNGVAGSRFTSRASREARSSDLPATAAPIGEIRLTAVGWARLTRIEMGKERAT